MEFYTKKQLKDYVKKNPAQRYVGGYVRRFFDFPYGISFPATPVKRMLAAAIRCDPMFCFNHESKTPALTLVHDKGRVELYGYRREETAPGYFQLRLDPTDVQADFTRWEECTQSND